MFPTHFLQDFMDLFVKTCGQSDFLGKKSLELEDIFSSHYLTKQNGKLKTLKNKAQEEYKKAQAELEEFKK